ncbi:MAG: glycosyltransferase family 4 protein [Lachnospiraceae bacterium]|nr:glycosyltransferase family 4 protein [Lachnospiraceae bacterium]
MKKILILANSSSGLYEFRQELIEALRTEYTIFASLPDRDMVEELEKLRCHVFHTEMSRRGMNPIEDLKLLREYMRIIREVKPSVVLTYTIKPNVYGGLACQICKVPYLANITGLGSALENGGWLQKVALFLYRIGLKKADTVYLQNTYNEAFVIEHHMADQAKKVLLPGSGVNLKRFPVLPFPVPKLQEELPPWGLDEEELAKWKAEQPEIWEDNTGFIFISRIMREKGIDQFLEMAENIKKRYSDTEFMILGACDEEYLDRIKALGKQGIVRYYGKVKDVRRYIARCQCLVHPSFYSEGISNVCLEAAASGRMVITTDHPGCRETVEDGKTGYLIPIQDSGKLIAAAEKVLAMTKEERQQMGLAGRTKVEKEFNRQIVVGEYKKEIDRLCRM